MTCASESTILRITSVTALTGLSRATIYRLSGSGKFPASLHLSDHCVGWRQSEVMDWIASRPATIRCSSGRRTSRCSATCSRRGSAICSRAP